MFIITDGNQDYRVEIIHNLPLNGKDWDEACFQISKKEFKRRQYHTSCFVIEPTIDDTPEEITNHLGIVILGWEDRYICNKIDGAKKAFTRAIKNFPRSTRKLFWQQYWEMEKQWV